MQNKLTEQLNKLEQSVEAAINAPFMKKAEFVEATVKESLEMCRELVTQNHKLQEMVIKLANQSVVLADKNLKLKKQMRGGENG